MAAVEDDARVFCDHLEASRPPSRRQPRANLIVSDGIQHMRGCHGQGGVRGLVVADERKPEVAMYESRPGDAEHVSVPAQGCRLYADLAPEAPELRGDAGGLRLHDLERLALATRDRTIAILDDGRLLVGDLADGVAEILLMVEVDVGDRRHAKVQRIGGVQPSPKTDFAHQPIDPRRQEHDRHRGQHLELGGRAHLRGDLVQGRQQVPKRVDEFVLADGPAVDLDPLGVRDQMRLGHKAHAVPGRTKDRGQAGARRALAVGARDERAAQFSIRCPQAVQDGSGSLGAELHRKAALPGEEVEGFRIRQTISQERTRRRGP